MSNIVNINQNAPSIVGAERKYNSVVVDGRQIPNMGCIDRDSHIEIILDNRWSYIFPKEIAHLAASLAANAMAIASDYSYLGAENKNHPFAPAVIMLDKLPE